MICYNNRIKDARLEKKLTQKQLAEKLTKLGHKTSNTAIANWESGLNKPDVDTLAALCKILDKEGNYFFSDSSAYESHEVQNHTLSITLLKYFEQLNDLGKSKAIENLKDLTEIPKYIEKKTGIQEA